MKNRERSDNIIWEKTMEGNIEGNEDGAGGSEIQKAGKVERKGKSSSLTYV